MIACIILVQLVAPLLISLISSNLYNYDLMNKYNMTKLSSLTSSYREAVGSIYKLVTISVSTDLNSVG